MEEFVRKKIYLDTSVVSYLRQEDAQEKMKDTLEFWELLKTEKYDIYISDVVITELSRCEEPKRGELLALIAEIPHTEIDVEHNVAILAIESEIERLNLIPPKSNDDRRHLAAAIYTRCNIIVSWNFRHMVNEKTIDGVRDVCLSHNTTPIDIYTPTFLLERGEYYE